MVTGAKQHGTALRDGDAGLRHRGLEIGRRDLGAGRDVAQVEADAGHDAFFQRILVDRNPAFAEMQRRVDMGAGVIDH